MTTWRLVQRAADTAPLVLLYLIGSHLDDTLRAILPGVGIAARVDAPHAEGRADIDAARALTGARGRLVLCGYSAGCQSVRALLVAGVEAAAVLTIDGTHASKPPATWQIDIWRTIAAEARRGELAWGATCTQQLYVEALPAGQAFTASRHVLEAAIGAELPAGVEVHEGSLHVYSYPSSAIDAPAHIRQQTEALPRLLRAHVAPLLLGAPVEPAPPSTPNAGGSTLPRLGVGERALEAALDELAAGVAEVPLGSNRGPRVDEYLRPTGLQGVAWCAAFASWCDREACDGDLGPLGYLPSVAGLWREAVKAGMARPASADPWRGDLVVFARAGSDPTKGGQGHVARVESWDATTVTTIDGNEGDRVARIARPRSAVLGVIAYAPESAAADLDGDTAGRLLALAEALEAGTADEALDRVENA